ncbi:ent-copalyl diphosphate synthase, chloroplastic isoform X2 [Cicer arietinum]|uniref:Ent-copalyl diphosphate synthase, chloroplastic isoform X2 n=1 Tax=Cicer arietinum TaxID=3827 RepID=A0A3Q7XMQ5_CICAR|nr:ent-copalyl diphosphate synthase, chloroplastic isoform X2 [Cicer arietinum]
MEWLEIVKKDKKDEEYIFQVFVTNEIRKRINGVKLMLRSMEDGEISISAYDTAWVALVKNVDDENKPQFPSSLQWIANNQLPDGSWGDELFVAHDRILNTLACVIALTTWNMHPHMCEKGMQFFVENLKKLQDENAEHMPIGFEVAFPSLLNIARSLNIEVPDDSPILKEIFSMRDQKLKKIPREVLHKVPTTLLHSLEGMQNLDWKQLLKLQSQDGSFLFSPSSTAFALMNTKDENALNYLHKIVNKFNGGVPNVFPVDLFEHMWAVDRLERLGISRYFQQEIKDSVNYVLRYWTDKGICWARNSEVQDIDDTAMGFRLLRLHGHQVSPDVFKHFEKSGEFVCFPGQLNQAVTGMFNLYRASQVLFHGENILENAKDFSAKFLAEKRASNQLLDKWIITKDLPGEVGYALDVPWYASLPRLETRFYLEQYGGENDVWIGKTLYRWLNKNKREEKLLEILLTTLDHLGYQMFRRHYQENSHYLNQMWQSWFSSWKNEGNRSQREAELLVQTINLTTGYWSEELQLNPQYQKLLEVTNRVCLSLRNYQNNKVHSSIKTPKIESEMQELVQLVLQNSPNGLQSNIKNSFLIVAKSFYYAAYCDQETIHSHIDKVLFQKVI